MAYLHYMATWNWVNIGSGNGLLLDGTKPSPEQCGLVINEACWHKAEGDFIETILLVTHNKVLENYIF